MFIRKIFRPDSTPLAPKIGRIPLPDVDDDYAYFEPASPGGYSDSASSSSSPSSPVPPEWIRPMTPQRLDLKHARRASTPHDPVGHRKAAPTPIKPSRHYSLTPGPEARSTYAYNMRVSTPPIACSSSPPSTLPVVPPHSTSPIEHPRPLKGILKPTPPPKPIKLHKLLVPYDPQQKMRMIYFDIGTDETFIRDHADRIPVHLTENELASDATAPFKISKMTIRFPPCPQWDVEISVPEGRGVTVRDVLHSIWRTYNEQLTADEQARYVSGADAARCRAYFRRRCKASRDGAEWEERQGMRRVDSLAGRTVFMGLTRPDDENRPDHHWVLELGLPRPSER